MNRFRIQIITAIVVLLTGLPASAAAQTGTITGQVLDQKTQRPIAAAAVSFAVGQEVVTDERGAFRLVNVPAGKQTLRVKHVGYGERSVEIEVPRGSTASIRITLSETAIALEPITVEALSANELRSRGAGFQRNVIKREAFARAENSNMTLADVLRTEVPSIRVRRLERVAGSAPCIELRTIRSTNWAGECLSPAVYLDGVPINNPINLYDNISLEMIESIEVIPANESGVRYGTGALFGALLIETRRPGRIADDENAPPRIVRPTNFDWKSDAQGHNTIGVFASSAVGNAVGLAIGVTLAKQCLGLRKPSNDGLITDCTAVPTIGAAAAGLLLPALGSSLGSRLAGQTDRSRGRFGPATVGATMALVPGYALVFTGQRNNSQSLQYVGYGIMTVGAPFISTAADYLFRKLR